MSTSFSEIVSAPGGAKVQTSASDATSSAPAFVWPVWNWHSIRDLLLSESKPQSHLRYHISAIRTAPQLYAQHVTHMIEQQVHLGWTVVMKARILAAAFSVKGEKTLAKQLLKSEGRMTLAEVLRAVQWLDSNRAFRQLKAKIDLLQERRAAKESSVKESTITKLQTLLAQLEAEYVNNDDELFRTPARGKGRRAKPATAGGVSFSGNKAIMIRKWAHSFPPETLSFFLLNFPKEPWKLLADLVHFSPKDFQLPFFLASIYDAPAPEGSMVHLASTCTRANLAACLEQERGLAACYSFFRTHFKEMRTRQAEIDASIADIMSMGFTRKQALLAKQHHPYNTAETTQQCVDWILENTNHINAAVDPSLNESKEDQQDLTSAAKACFGRWAPLEDLLWYYEELESPEVAEAIFQRLSSGEQLNPSSPRSNFGKLLERILLCRKKNVKFWKLLLPLADRRLQAMKQQKATMGSGLEKEANQKVVPVDSLALLASAVDLPEQPSSSTSTSTSSSAMTDDFISHDGSKGFSARIAVLGDASGSMEVAIQSASSLGALLSAVLDAELSFFNDKSFKPPVQPRNAEETLRVIDAVKAQHSTSMAAALLPYYESKEKIDLFIMVSDEGENAAAKNGMMFAPLYKLYLDEVNPECKLFLVSFLPNNLNVVGDIKQRLNDIKLGEDVAQYRFDINRPDTSKFDSLLGTLSLEIELIKQRKKEIKEVLVKNHGVPNVLLDIVAEY